MVMCATATDTTPTSTLTASDLAQLVDQLYDNYCCTSTSIGSDDLEDVFIPTKRVFKPRMKIGKSHPSIFKKKKEVYYVCARRRIA